MKYQRLKDMVLGGMVAILIVGAVPNAFAKVSKMNIPVSFNNIKVVIDGQELKTDKEPFTYEGTTYLPVRAVAEAVGKDVRWDSKTQTVTLGFGSEIANKSEVKTISKTIGDFTYEVPDTWKEKKQDGTIHYYLDNGVILMNLGNDMDYAELDDGGVEGFVAGLTHSDKRIDLSNLNKKNLMIGDIEGKKVDLNLQKQYDGVNVEIKSVYFIGTGTNIVYIVYYSAKDSIESDKQLENMIASFKKNS